MKLRLGINVFGRIGRSVFRHLLNNKNISIVDSGLTSVNENIIKLLAWYDNESAYSKRLIDLAELVATSEK